MRLPGDVIPDLDPLPLWLLLYAAGVLSVGLILCLFLDRKDRRAGEDMKRHLAAMDGRDQ